jgi:hypothetical protein
MPETVPPHATWAYSRIRPPSGCCCARRPAADAQAIHGAEFHRPQERPPDDIPVSAHRFGGDLYALTDARWRHNFRDGADVEVTLDGHVSRMREYLVDDPETVAPIYARIIGQLGVKRAQRMVSIKIHTLGPLGAEALAEAARRYHMRAIRLSPNP